MMPALPLHHLQFWTENYKFLISVVLSVLIELSYIHSCIRLKLPDS
jgi:hypothetical protein